MSLLDTINLSPPTGDKWDFENPKHKKRLIEILSERDGFWCRLCGSTSALSIHHLRPRGQVSAEVQVIDEKTGEVFYRDDPRNLCFLCTISDPYIHKIAGLEKYYISCHTFVHNHPLKAKELGLLISPIFATKKEE